MPFPAGVPPLHRAKVIIDDPKRTLHGRGSFDLLPALGGLLRRLSPKTHAALERTFSVQPQHRLVAKTLPHPDLEDNDADSAWVVKAARWLKFDGLLVGRNSKFQIDELSDEQLEQIGGIEYRALRWLTYLVPFVRPPSWFSLIASYSDIDDDVMPSTSSSHN